MKKSAIRLGFVLALTVSASAGFAHATPDNGRLAPQATKQTCC